MRRATAFLLAAWGFAVVCGGAVAGEPSAALREVAVAAAQARVGAPDRLVVESVRLMGSVPPEVSGWRVASVRGPNRSGVVQIVCVAGAVEARLLVRGRVVGPALRATRTLLQGEAIPDSAVERVEADWTALPEPPLRDPAALAGLAPRRAIGAGRLLTARDLAPAPVVRRGEVVELVWRRPGLSVRALGRARRDGAPGEVIPAENPRTGVIVLAEVQPDGSLRVLRRADPWRRGNSR